MKKLTAVLMSIALLASFTPARGQGSSHSITARAASIVGSAGGEISLTAGGTFEPRSGLLQIRGALRIARAFVNGPLAGRPAGESLRWEGANIIPSLAIDADGTEGGAARPAVTDGTTLVLQAELFGPGDRVSASQRAKMIVSASDLDVAQDGVQNVWIEGVGFGSAEVTIR